jgi:hypothetical protein
MREQLAFTLLIWQTVQPALSQELHGIQTGNSQFER